MRLRLKDVIRICGGRYEGPSEQLEREITGVSTDTRDVLTGKLFIPLKGPHFDGHDFLAKAREKGAAAVLSERTLSEGDPVYVASTYQALADLAAHQRASYPVPLVAVTGSAGKTTTKDMIACVLSEKFCVLKTEGNLNNEIGLPQMVLQLSESTEVAVLEMGMNHKGEIHRLSRVAQPDICVITNIGDAHIEHLGSRQGILEAKTEIFDFMNPNGVCVLNADDPLLTTLADHPQTRGKKIIWYSVKTPMATIWADALYTQPDGATDFRIHTRDKIFGARIALPGTHLVLNALAAAAIGLALGVTPEEIQRGLKKFSPTGGRTQILKTPLYTIVNDVYNANPTSVKAALDTLVALSPHQRKAAILGDMFELGEHAAALHEEIGRCAARAKISLLLCVGAWAAHIERGFALEKKEGQQCYSFISKEECAAQLNNLLQPNDVILVKGSRGMAMETLVQSLSGERKEG
jgi:UDP-N-acetylmuramoyl-tripeptide--D-alanyl-D-alanine ligase